MCNDSLMELISFNQDKARLIADLVHLKLADFLNFQESYQVFSDGESYLLYHYAVSLYMDEEHDEEYQYATYRHFYKFH